MVSDLKIFFQMGNGKKHFFFVIFHYNSPPSRFGISTFGAIG